MLCPTCVEVRLLMTERSGIEIDYCPTCRGVWLDRGELDKLIDRAAAVPLTMPEPATPRRAPSRDELRREYDRGYNREYQRDDKKKRKKSFLSELFEFGD